MESVYKPSFSVKTYWKEILAILVLLFAIYFFRSQIGEIKSIVPRIKQADSTWAILGVLTTLIYVLLQALMYLASFRSVGIRVSIWDATELFLKRNLLSVFLPMGSVSSLAYTPVRLKKKNVGTAQGAQASIINGYIGILTVFLVGVPVIAYALANNQNFNHAWVWLILLGFILAFLLYLTYSFVKKGWVHQLIYKISPLVCGQLESLFAESVDKKQLSVTITASCLIEVISILMVYISLRALGLTVTIETASIGYFISVIPMMLSPFLHGLGAVELSMAFFFSKVGYNTEIALSATLIYRIFEFWLPLALGLVVYLWKGKELLGRILPAAGIFILGVANILSVLDIPLSERFHFELAYLPLDSLHASRLMILFAGIVMIMVAANMLKGHRNAFILALVLTIVSLTIHFFRGYHNGEGLLTVAMLFLLVLNRREYRVKPNKKWLTIGFGTFFMALIAVCLFDAFGFYLLEKRHFGMDFSWAQSMEYTLKSFFLFSYSDLVPNSRFAEEFLYIVHMLALSIWTFLVLVLFTSAKIKQSNTHERYAEAEQIIRKHGQSSLDFYKLSRDKSFFIIPDKEALVSYKIANGFAVVLEEPVCPVAEKANTIQQFEAFCLENGLKTCYYRVGEEALDFFKPVGLKKALIGQEAILELDQFALTGAEHKSLRNGQNHLLKQGFSTELYRPPHKKALLAELHEISDAWLKAYRKKEVVFSSGMFDPEELKTEVVILIRNAEKKPVAFLNIVPDFAPEECTYDMLRKTKEAMNGCEDALIIRLIEYAKENGYKRLNLGMASFTGITNPENMPEQITKYASERIKPLQHFHGLRNFKDKYASSWLNKYLIYGNDYDLLNIPVALSKVIRVSKST